MTVQIIPDESFTAAANPSPEYSQLFQVHVPLEEAADAFNVRDASGRTPIVIIPKQLNRVNNDLVLAAVITLVASILTQMVFNNWVYLGIGIPVALILLTLGLYRSFIVRIPEGANGLLARGGRYVRTITSGSHIIPPWFLVTHLVTRRQIPFDAPVIESPSQDNVRVNVDMLITFTITDPFQFIFSISADDFDQIFLAACQDALRTMVRQISSHAVLDLTRGDTQEILTKIAQDVEPYGISINKVNITYAGPPIEFMVLKESERLVDLQQIEQQHKQALAVQMQENQDDLARHKVLAQVERERSSLQLQVQAAELKQRIVELEANAEDLRLARLEQRLRNYPNAAKWDIETAQMDIARALAGNTRAVVQVGKGSDISQAFLLGDNLKDEQT